LLCTHLDLGTSVNLTAFCDLFSSLGFPSVSDSDHPSRRAVQDVKSQLGPRLTDDQFLLDCVGRELDLIERTVSIRRGLVPFHTIEELGIRFALGHWAPGSGPGPHEHTAWTITAVCNNELNVTTYDYVASYDQGKLVAKNHFQATAGKAGFIYEAGIHAPRNNSLEWSLSLHITSPRDGERPPGFSEPLPALLGMSGSPRARADHPYSFVQAARQRLRYVDHLARFVASLNPRLGLQLLSKCSALGSSETRLWIARAVGNSGNGNPTSWRLERTHQSLSLSSSRNGDMIGVMVNTEAGRIEELAVGALASEAVAFVVEELSFDVRSIPGNLSEHERATFAFALEETGLFRRVA
jgi:hypothetical protein